ncbi:MAG TPA: epoxide hydrolase [Humisphaera sp.]
MSLCRPRPVASSTASVAIGFALFSLAGCGPSAPTPDDRGDVVYTSPAAPPASADDELVRPFRVAVPDVEIADLRRRIAATRWPEQELVADHSQGVPLATMRELARYWATDYDWRRCEARLNALPQFVTRIDGLDVHFIHVRSKHPGALPVVITHGWPGSVVELLKVIGPLTDPTAHGGRAEDAFDVVIPSLPGYGFSGKPAAPGWDPPRVARAWAVLMKRLGYTRFVAQGGDWGSAVVDQMALQAPPGLLAIHTNMPAAVPPEIAKAVKDAAPTPAGLAADERRAYESLVDFYTRGIGYATEMRNRPQTLYGLADSPVGLAAWILDHDKRSLVLIARVFDGTPEGLTRDDVLDNVTLYWLTNTAVSSARLYWEFRQPVFDAKGVTAVPVAVSVFPDEIYAAPRSWAARSYPTLVYFNTVDRGGHFAAWEQPQLFAEELRSAFRRLR